MAGIAMLKFPELLKYPLSDRVALSLILFGDLLKVWSRCMEKKKEKSKKIIDNNNFAKYI